jgi:hypothetical protein
MAGTASQGTDFVIPAPTSIIGTVPAPGTGRGYLIQIGKLSGLNLNAVAATTIFTTPAAGFSRCVVYEVVVDNFSGAPTTNAMSLGSSGTPTDWLGATVLAATAGVGKIVSLFPAVNIGYAVYSTGVAFVANVTVGGAAITADITCLGWYE